MKTEKLIPTEYEECKTFRKWLDSQGLIYSHLPLENFSKDEGIIWRNKAIGVHGGVPDYLIITPKGLVFVEMKRTKGSVVQPSQQKWIEELNKLEGVEARVCKGADEAINYVSEFLKTS